MCGRQAPIVFTRAISLHMDIEAINFQGNETHLSDFPASSFILGMKKISLTGLNIAVNQYMQAVSGSMPLSLPVWASHFSLGGIMIFLADI